MAVFMDEKPDIVWRGWVKMFSAEMNAIVFEKKSFILFIFFFKTHLNKAFPGV